MRNFNDRSCWLFEYWPFDYLRLGRLKARFVEILYLLVIELHDILPQMGKIFQYFLAIVYWSSCSPQLIVWLRPWRMIYNICWRSLFSACLGIWSQQALGWRGLSLLHSCLISWLKSKSHSRIVYELIKLLLGQLLELIRQMRVFLDAKVQDRRFFSLLFIESIKPPAKFFFGDFTLFDSSIELS